MRQHYLVAWQVRTSVDCPETAQKRLMGHATVQSEGNGVDQMLSESRHLRIYLPVARAQKLTLTTNECATV